MGTQPLITFFPFKRWCRIQTTQKQMTWNCTPCWIRVHHSFVIDQNPDTFPGFAMVSSTYRLLAKASCHSTTSLSAVCSRTWPKAKGLCRGAFALGGLHLCAGFWPWASILSVPQLFIYKMVRTRLSFKTQILSFKGQSVFLCTWARERHRIFPGLV